jgi:hypothetical protein
MSMTPDTAAFEPHFRVGQLAKQWNYGYETVRNLVKTEPGVLHLKLGKKRSNTTYSVPESVAIRIHTRLTSAVGQ